MKPTNQSMEIAQHIIEVISLAARMGDFIDSSDRVPTKVDDDSAQFEMSQCHDVVGPGSRRTVGRMVYTVTVTGKYVAGDDE